MASTMSTPGHDREIGEVSGKEWLVDGDVLQSHDPLLALDFDYAVDQQKRKPVRQNTENIDDVQRRLVQLGFVRRGLIR